MSLASLAPDRSSCACDTAEILIGTSRMSADRREAVPTISPRPSVSAAPPGRAGVAASSAAPAARPTATLRMNALRAARIQDFRAQATEPDLLITFTFFYPWYRGDQHLL